MSLHFTWVWMAHGGAPLAPGAHLRFGSLNFTFSESEESLIGAIFARPEPSVDDHAAATCGEKGGTPRVTTDATARILNMLGDDLAAILGPNPTQERFHLIAYSITNLALQAEGEEQLDWGEFLDHYDAMYPERQPGLPHDRAAAPIPTELDLHLALVTEGTTDRAAAAPQPNQPPPTYHDPSRECFMCYTLDGDVRDASSRRETDTTARCLEMHLRATPKHVATRHLQLHPQTTRDAPA